MRSLTDGEFGVALACHIQHDDVIERIAKQMLRLTKPSGYIVVMEWIVGNKKAQYNAIPHRKIESVFGCDVASEVILINSV